MGLFFGIFFSVLFRLFFLRFLLDSLFGSFFFGLFLVLFGSFFFGLFLSLLLLSFVGRFLGRYVFISGLRLHAGLNLLNDGGRGLRIKRRCTTLRDDSRRARLVQRDGIISILICDDQDTGPMNDGRLTATIHRSF